MWCLMRANHSPAKVKIGTQYISVKRGQFITGRKEAAKALKMAESTVRNYLDFLACRRSYKYRLQQNPFTLLDIQPHKLFSIITVKYYDDLQSFGQAFGQQKDTTNNEDNDLNTRNSLRDEDKDISKEQEDIIKEIEEKGNILRHAIGHNQSQYKISLLTDNIKRLKKRLKILMIQKKQG